MASRKRSVAGFKEKEKACFEVCQRDMWRRWLRHPLASDLGAAGAIGWCGDRASQAIESSRASHPRELDPVRTRSVVSYGVLAAVPYQCAAIRGHERRLAVVPMARTSLSLSQC